MKYEEIINNVSKELKLSARIIDRTYKAYWYFIKQRIQSLPLKEELSEEDFNKLQTSFNIPSLGKLNCTYNKMLGMKKRYQLINNIRRRK